MGLFSSKKITVVSSVIYNLLGEDEPTNYTSTSVLDAIINPKDNMSLSENLFQKITKGPAANFRRYMQWTKSSDYQTYLGLATSTYYNVDFLTNTKAEKLLKEYLNLADSASVTVSKAEFARYNMFLFADAWVVNNRPDQKDTEYTVTDKPIYKYPDRPPGGLFNKNYIIRYDIQITFTDGSTQVIDTSSFDTNARYLYIQYYIKENESRTYEYLTYKQGDGFQGFDDLFSQPEALENTYSAFLPFRAWNTFLSDEEGKEYLPEVYRLAKKGANIAIGDNKYTELMESIADNKDIGEIDFAYLHFGVPLNIPYDFGKEYLFEYFNNLADYNTEFGKPTLISLSTLYIPPDPETGYGEGYRDYYGRFFNEIKDQESVIPGTIYIRSPGTNLNFNITINWDHITKTTKQGLVKPDAKVGKFYVWYQKDPVKVGEGLVRVWVESGGGDGGYEYKSIGDVFASADVLYLVHQESSTRYTEIQVWNAEQLNYIYKGKFTATYTDEAFSTKNELSDFIIPIQYNSFLETNMAKMNSTMQCCYNLVFNCYKTYKKRWYQSGIFGIIITVVVVVIAVVITVISKGSLAAYSASLVGTVGGSLAAGIGLTVGTIAYIVVASAVNAICAIVLTKVVATIATNAFGEKLGTIIGAIASLVISVGISNGFNLSETITSISNNLPQFTASVVMQGGNAYTKLLNLKAQSILAKINDLYLSYQDKMEEIQEKTDELLGYNQYSPLFLSSVLDPEEPLVYEDRDTFLARTLMVGSDIVDLTLNSITNFTKLNLNLELT